MHLRISYRSGAGQLCRVRTAYVIRTDDERTKLAMLVQSMEPSGRDNNYQVGLTCINYDARYYQDD